MVLNIENIWDKVLDIIKSQVVNVSFATWFGDTKLIELTDDTIKLQVPMPIHKKILTTNYNDLIVDSFTKVTGVERTLECYLKNEMNNQLEDTIMKVIDSNIEPPAINDFESNLNPNYTFDNFVVGDTNKFAKTSALAVAENPGTQWNPLFIYGKSGLGKTHLMHAIGNFIADNHPEFKVLYTGSDDFKKDFTGSISDKNNSMSESKEFNNKYRNLDVLIIDDIQFLVGADRTQEEFFHTFNYLHSKNKQIIISSDRSPDDLQLLQERLRSRFAWGLPVDIYPPDFELRCRIIRDKIKYLNIANRLNDDAIEFIANNFDTDVRSLEGAINRLVAYTAMYPPEKNIIDLDFTAEALKDYVNKNVYNMNDISSIQKAVADYYNITVEVLKGKKRSSNIVYPRMVAMYLCRMLTEESFPRIGLEFGGKDHSTVIHACDKIEEDLKNNNQLKEIINEIKSKL